ncbi:hypothetical protein OHB26_09525 [Nocardia sp. NBC_01503]|uniref:hypothetical protein n=1 Tax=Nocardia sp. NBC_01503 TaxID=2975997 RepID=UPI002E7BBAEC|nr:hypothetical protein [Nocardia sp. NBC_01503]WTL34415.1 hypothetical protein OHB26_09525 [Nocardia sp. NBC_01503]
MPDNSNEPLLPIPSDLYSDIADAVDKVQDLRRTLKDLRDSYEVLDRSPEALRVDNLGDPIEQLELTNRVLGALHTADARLSLTDEALNRAHRAASRLSLTDAAADHRENQLTEQQQRRPRRTR